MAGLRFSDLGNVLGLLGLASSLFTTIIGIVYTWYHHPVLQLKWSECGWSDTAATKWVDCNSEWASNFGMAQLPSLVPLLMGIFGTFMYRPMLLQAMCHAVLKYAAWRDQRVVQHHPCSRLPGGRSDRLEDRPHAGADRAQVGVLWWQQRVGEGLLEDDREGWCQGLHALGHRIRILLPALRRLRRLPSIAGEEAEEEGSQSSPESCEVHYYVEPLRSHARCRHTWRVYHHLCHRRQSDGSGGWRLRR